MQKRANAAQGILAVAGLVAVSLCLFLPLANPDIFWHLSAGRYIAAHKALPGTDFLSWSMAGRPWTDFEWLPQLLYFWGWTLAGYWGLLACRFLLLLPLLFVIYRIALLYAERLTALLALVIGAAVLLPNLDLRPENFSLLFFSLLFYLLEKTRLSGTPEHVDVYSAFCAAMFALWANCHAGFVYGLALLGFYCAGELLRVKLPAIYGRREKEDYSFFKAYALWFGCAAAGTLANAYGVKIYAVLWAHMREIKVIGEHLREWQPADLAQISQAPFWVLLALSFVGLLHRALRHRDLPFHLLLCWMFFAVSAAQHSRMTAFFALTAVPLMLYVLSLYAREGVPPLRLKLGVSAAALAASGFLFFIAYWHLGGPRWRYTSPSEGPVRFLSGQKQALAGSKLYNPWGWGGYLGFALWPDYKVFLDGRYIFHTYLPEVQTARADNLTWTRFLSKYGFQTVLLERSSSTYPTKVTVGKLGEKTLHFPFYAFFMPATDWALVYWDDNSMIFVRREEALRAWLEKNEFHAFRPDNAEVLHAKMAAGLQDKEALRKEAARMAQLLSGLGLSQDASSAQAYAHELLLP